MKIDHEYEALKDYIEEMHYRGDEFDTIYWSLHDEGNWKDDTLDQAITEVEHRVNDVPNEGFYIEEPNPYSN